MNRTEILVFVQSWENLRRKLVVSDTILFSSKITFFVRKKYETIAHVRLVLYRHDYKVKSSIYLFSSEKYKF